MNSLLCFLITVFVLPSLYAQDLSATRGALISQKGTFGQIFRGHLHRKWRPDKTIAIKVMKDANHSEFLDEKTIIDQFQESQAKDPDLKFRNILKYYGTNEKTEEIYMELMDGDLSDKMLRAQPDFQNQRLSILRQIFHGIDSLHQHGFIHGDLKLANILYRKQRNGTYKIKIADFGHTHWGYIPPDKNVYMGTNTLCSPELCMKNTLGLTSQLDLWPAGLLTAKLWGAKLSKGISKSAYLPDAPDYPMHRGPIREQISDPMISKLVKHLMRTDPNKRISAAEVLKRLKK